MMRSVMIVEDFVHSQKPFFYYYCQYLLKGKAREIARIRIRPRDRWNFECG